jgi:hypothetical protein
LWQRQIPPHSEEEPNFAIFKDNAHEASDVALRGIFANTHAQLVDAQIKLDIVATELERRTRG